MAIRFVTDSASDILPSEAKALGLRVVPLTVSFDGVEYADTVDLTPTEFYNKLVESDALPTTSQVTPAAFAAAFEEVTANGDEVVAVVLSSKLSGTYQSACIAAEDFPGKVHIVDSLSATIGERMLILEGLELARQGMSAADIAAKLDESKHQLRILALLDTLEYLKKGGRISAATAFAGGVLSIKPVITVNEGAVELIGKARGSKNGNNLLRKLIADCGGVDFDRPYGLVYSGFSDAMLKKYIDDSADLWQNDSRELPVHSIGCVIGTHVGPGAIGVAFFEKK